MPPTASRRTRHISTSARDITFGATYNSSYGSSRYVDTGFGDTVETYFTVPCVPPLTNVAYDGNDYGNGWFGRDGRRAGLGRANGATGIHVYVKNSWASASASNYFPDTRYRRPAVRGDDEHRRRWQCCGQRLCRVGRIGAIQAVRQQQQRDECQDNDFGIHDIDGETP